MRHCYRLLIGIALAASFAAPALAQSGGTKVGVLTCRTSTRIGLIVGSHQRMRCSYAPDNGGPPEYYHGYINRLGLDLGVTTGGVLAWGVIAPTNGVPHGALAGKYAGASGSAAVGLGVGANALIGGSHRSCAAAAVGHRTGRCQSCARCGRPDAALGELANHRPLPRQRSRGEARSLSRPNITCFASGT